jgi:hypothetical protein
MDKNPNYRYAANVKNCPYEGPGWNGKVTVCFSYPHVGWILLWISGTSYIQEITISISEVFDPFPKMVEWLEAIAANQLPAEMDIDEEGKVKNLTVMPLENDQVDFIIRKGYVEEGEIFFRMRASRKQLVSEFAKKLDLMLKEYFEIEEWEQGSDLRKLDLTRLWKFLAEQVK